MTMASQALYFPLTKWYFQDQSKQISPKKDRKGSGNRIFEIGKVL